MATLTQSREQAIFEAFKRVTDAHPSDIDSGLRLLAKELITCMSVRTLGAGAPSEPSPPVSQDGDRYFDTANHVEYIYKNGFWVIDL